MAKILLFNVYAYVENDIYHVLQLYQYLNLDAGTLLSHFFDLDILGIIQCLIVEIW